MGLRDVRVAELTRLRIGWMRVTHDTLVGDVHILRSTGTPMARDTTEASVVASQERLLDEDLLPCLQRRQLSTSPLPFGQLFFLLRLNSQILHRFLISVTGDTLTVVQVHNLGIASWCR